MGIKKIGLGLATGGGSILAGKAWEKSKGALMGGQDIDPSFGVVPETAEQTAARKRGYESLFAAQDMINKEAPIEQQADYEVQTQLKGEAGRLGDIKRRAQQLIAQRGMQGSSIGLTQQIGAEREAQDRMQAVQASLPERIRQLQRERADRLSSLGSQMVGAAGKQDVFQKEKTQGLLPGLLTGIGAVAGGMSTQSPQGAMVGGQLGGTLGSAITNYRR